jgi:hypothetical protein
MLCSQAAAAAEPYYTYNTSGQKTARYAWKGKDWKQEDVPGPGHYYQAGPGDVSETARRAYEGKPLRKSYEWSMVPRYPPRP